MIPVSLLVDVSLPYELRYFYFFRGYHLQPLNKDEFTIEFGVKDNQLSAVLQFFLF